MEKCNDTVFNLQNNLLANCDSVICSGKFFKCPKSYCIPKRHECNARWDCPGGQDEIKCSLRMCSGKFHCHNSTICISKGSICDGILDCIFHDDETFCNLPVCPVQCACLLYGTFVEQISDFSCVEEDQDRFRVLMMMIDDDDDDDDD